MLGAIIGDIIGSRFEFNPTNDFNFELFTEECSFTDDTICTCAIADALLNNKDFGESLHEWCSLYPYPQGGYGGRFAHWVNSDNPQPYGSFGNGSAMRVSPVARICRGREDVLEKAKQTALCTHNHPEGIKGAQTVALARFVAIQERAQRTKTNDVVKSVIKECVEYSGYNINLRKKEIENRFDETCLGTVPVALWIINNSNSFEDAIRRAVSIGADADTLGAIVGSIAEAIWGIPKEIIVKAYSFLDVRIIKLLQNWMICKSVFAIDIKSLAEKYIRFFSTYFENSPSSKYEIFDSPIFPYECWYLGFEMDCGHSFIEAYGKEAWRSDEGLSLVVSKINDIKLLGSGLFSQWRYFNHWSYSDPTEKDIKWFLTILRRMQELAY